MKAAGRSVRFQIVNNQHTLVEDEFRALVDPIEGAEIIEAPDNAISLQSLSDREVVIAFPGMESYTTVLIYDHHFVRIIGAWLGERFAYHRACDGILTA